MNTKVYDQSKLMFIILSVLALLNFFVFPDRIFIQIFTVGYLFIIYKKFAKNNKDFLYYSTLLLAIVNFSMEIPLTTRYSIYYFYVTLFIYMMGLIDYCIKHRKNISIKKLFKNPYISFLIVFILYMIFTMFIAESKKLAVKYIYNFFIMVSLAIMMCFHNKNEKNLGLTFKFLKYLFAGILSLGILEICGISYGIRNHFVEWDPMAAQIEYVKHIPVTFFYNPNNYAVFLVLGMTALAISFLFSDNKKDKMVYSLLYFIAQINLIFTRSRTAWISIFLIILFCMGFYALKFKNNKRKILKLTQIFSVTVLVFVAISCIPSMKPYYGKFSTSKFFHFKKNDATIEQPAIVIGKKGSDNQRATLMYDVVHGVFYQKHYLGFGPGNIEKHIEKMNNTFGVFNVHSLWFEILGDFGILFFVYYTYVYLSIIIKNLFLYYKNIEYENPQLIISACLMFGFIFLSFAPSSVMWYTPFWIVLGISINTINVNNERY
ncbi:O-antigen ligase family protein [Clostridium botulinum]|uniref:O-antigen ligase family protein n=1 Tax=Clostridium botulinum TaxID=1491 RepID=UPI0009473636|nr:O-antigen ligase family protein [Clostridium botulinum]APQ95869.1 O-Antigen ligase family protein [Clostridium botulinum]MBN3363609.1 O-antigen ligase domain-containing protein [Clostridium botulinum]